MINTKQVVPALVAVTLLSLAPAAEALAIEEHAQAAKPAAVAADKPAAAKPAEAKADTKKDTASTSSGTKEYTVKDGDTMWTIAQSQLGNGAEYQKILDANGLKESDTLAPGTVIKIPQ